MEINFEKVGNQYVAEFEATADFNLHIEREENGVLEVHQRGSEEGKYDFAWGTGVNGRKVVDYDFGALVYPKFIKVVSGSEVVSASVNFNEGGGSGSGSGSNVKHFSIYNWTGNPYNGDNETLRNKLTFTFEFEEGMTWQDWVNSKYNILGMSLFDDGNANGRAFLWIGGSKPYPLLPIDLAYSPQNGEQVMQTDKINSNDEFIYAGSPLAF